jgi:hypothetical protein
MMQAWAHDHRGKGGHGYCSDSAKERMDTYTTMHREKHGAEADPLQHPVDQELVMRAGGGNKNGRHLLCTGAISTSSDPKLSQIRA